MVCHSNCKHLRQGLLPAIHQFSEPEGNIFGVGCWEGCTERFRGAKLLRYRGRKC